MADHGIVKIDRVLHRRLRLLCAHKDITIQMAAEEAVTAYLLPLDPELRLSVESRRMLLEKEDAEALAEMNAKMKVCHYKIFKDLDRYPFRPLTTLPDDHWRKNKRPSVKATEEEEIRRMEGGAQIA